MPELQEFRPKWAPHVVGTFEAREPDPETGEWKEQKVAILCEQCRAEWKVTCNRGQPREHVAKFALSHLHKDPLG